MYIVIEGIDTAGKSTQLDILKKRYKKAVFTKEPGGTKLGAKIREIVLNAEAKSNLAEMFMFLADRAEHTNEIILKNKDKVVISDRSLISGIAYAQNMKLKELIRLNKIAISNSMPTHIILLELSKKELEYRLSQKQNDGIELRGVEYLLNIQKRMKKTIEKLKINHIFIDASLDVKSISKKIEEFIGG